ncbi:MAG: winged helix-turn-helix transcriptional regulator [Candidatus Scalindua sp.]|jgi:DNA-binding MarR family transcriptional regulator|nr:winged helix-turn-helix transcriptional regulator [Candidatus Scalindua sp.]MBT6046035.1 winged helix-turn-helix transcriptional regulator [Candidatus Scalindua sp.]MBT6231136.1 winged helix-turn-helix transcriptional regulator [Candidatus Scalindua sp.]
MIQIKQKSGDIDIRELKILERLESNGHLTQRDLSKEVGIALGLVNHLLKKMVKKGWIKIKNIDAKKIRYLITPEGAREKSSLLYKRVEGTIHFYLEAKRVIKDKVIHLKNEGIEDVSIYGINHISEVLFIVLKELGLELAHVVDDNKEGDVWFGYTVVKMDEFVKSNTNVLILASFDKEEIDGFCKEQENVKVVVLRE